MIDYDGDADGDLLLVGAAGLRSGLQKILEIFCCRARDVA